MSSGSENFGNHDKSPEIIDLSQGRIDYSLGNSHFELGNYDGAIQHFEIALKDPDIGLNIKYDILQKYQKIGEKYFSDGENKKAIKCYKRALKLDPSNKGIRLSLSNLHGLLGDDYFKEKNYEEAEKYYEKALKINPSMLNTYSESVNNVRDNLSKTYYELGFYKVRPSERKKYFEKILGLEEGDSAMAFIAKSYILYLDDKYDKGLEICEKALKLYPKNIELLRLKGFLYMYIGKKPLDNFDKSMEICNEILELEPNNQKVLYTIGLTYYKKGDKRMALEKWMQIKDINVILMVEENLYIRNEYDLIIKFGKRILKLYPENIRTLNYIGLGYLGKEDYFKAMEFFNQILKLDSTNKLALTNIGYFYIKSSKDYNKAVDCYMKIEDADALLERGWYLFDEEKYDLAIKIYNRVLELDPRNVLALSDIGTSYYYKEDYKKAKIYYEKALKIDPKNQYSIDYLKKVKGKLNEK